MRRWHWFYKAAICVALVTAAYLPCLNNGFIADDFVALQTVDILKTNPLYLFSVPPANFRSTSFVAYGVLKELAGYRAEVFYGFNIVLHFINVILFWNLLILLTEDEFIATLAAALFAVFQAPQEAVMWIAAMNETLLGFFVLWTLIFWLKRRYGWGTLCYALALFSKESALVVLALIPMVQLYRGEKPFPRSYAWLMIPTGLFASVFLFEWSSNFMISNGFYSVGPKAGIVLLKSLERLLWPWFVVIVILLRLVHKSWPSLKTVGWGILWTSVPLLPYIFMIYQSSVPSRQVYLSSAVLMTVFALMLKPLARTKYLAVLVVVFVAFNIHYLWYKKDPQFVGRAAPTNELLSVMRSHKPEKLRIIDFPYPFPSIAQAASLGVPGWTPNMIVVSQSETDCQGCPTETWNPRTQGYAP